MVQNYQPDQKISMSHLIFLATIENYGENLFGNIFLETILKKKGVERERERIQRWGSWKEEKFPNTAASGDGSSNGTFFRALLLVRRGKAQYDEACGYVERARKCLATELAALMDTSEDFESLCSAFNEKKKDHYDYCHNNLYKLHSAQIGIKKGNCRNLALRFGSFSSRTSGLKTELLKGVNENYQGKE
ncbi:hypothetical protein D8674_011109 [Pyrus ussuriensis x Pyrus communis]|uniref:Uncharacterized protein n=1 Tax=Pyrus ussuriensis x Pyrus communis TaxID=2448454 RepID=A0A5N5G2C3_9ROSA|nr:hypothetical protein D8674_011109 [Pyrus ussuriensis x Pyrus communis]